MTRPDREVTWALRILLGVLVFLVLIWVLGGARESAGQDLPTVEPECLDPPLQWQPGEPPWDGSLYRFRFCVPHQDVSGRPIRTGEILGCGLGLGRNTLPGYMTWLFTVWKLGLEPGEIVIHYLPVDANSIIQGTVQALEVTCVRRGRTPEEAVVGLTGVTDYFFPGPEPPPEWPMVPSLRVGWLIALVALLAYSGANLARGRA